MGHVVIAPVGDNLKALFIGIKEFSTERVILLSPKENLREAHSLARKLEEFTIHVEIQELGPNLMGGMFAAFGEVCSRFSEEQLLVNVATGDRLSTCAALSAAYANGLRAFGVMGEHTMLLPIMKLSYYDHLSESKFRILQALREEWEELGPLAAKLKISSSLLHYHIQGSSRYRGLKEMRLVEAQERGKSLMLRRSTLGELLLRGYISQEKRPRGARAAPSL